MQFVHFAYRTNICFKCEVDSWGIGKRFPSHALFGQDSLPQDKQGKTKHEKMHFPINVKLPFFFWTLQLPWCFTNCSAWKDWLSLASRKENRQSCLLIPSAAVRSSPHCCHLLNCSLFCIRSVDHSYPPTGAWGFFRPVFSAYKNYFEHCSCPPLFSWQWPTRRWLQTL